MSEKDPVQASFVKLHLDVYFRELKSSVAKAQRRYKNAKYDKCAEHVADAMLALAKINCIVSYEAIRKD